MVGAAGAIPATEVALNAAAHPPKSRPRPPTNPATAARSAATSDRSAATSDVTPLWISSTASRGTRVSEPTRMTG